MRKGWIVVVLLGLLCCASCTGPNDDLDTSKQTPGQSPAVERFIGRGDGVVQDTRTGLEWTSQDNDRDLSWHQADRYCRELTLGGRTDWRLPEIGELKGLYDERLDQPCGDWTCHVDPAVGLTDPYFWGATHSGSSRRSYVDFQHGTSLSPRLKPGLVRRALCVRGP
jgi:hypothetical protein